LAALFESGFGLTLSFERSYFWPTHFLKIGNLGYYALVGSDLTGKGPQKLAFAFRLS
jgi:hypothetical protein